MASLKDIRRRIASVKNTQKITKAMKLVAAAKFARANAAVVSSRPYGKAFDSMVAKLAQATGGEVDSPLLDERDEKKVLIAVLGTDRGFCGSLNANLNKTVLRWATDKEAAGVTVHFACWGRRPGQFFGKKPELVNEKREKVNDKPSFDTAKELADHVVSQFVSGDYDKVYLAFNEFRSAMSQEPVVKGLLPLGVAQEETDDASANMLVEPDAATLLRSLLEKSIASSIFRSMLEAAASEHGSRMTAMDSATNNATEVVNKLTVDYNRARQAAITNELIEITSGANAL